MRRLVTLTGDRPPGVWDARVVDSRGRIWKSCDHGHPTAASAEACGAELLAALV